MVDSLAVVMDSGGLAMDRWCPGQFCPHRLAYALMSQAHPQYGDFPTEVPHCLVRDACFYGVQGPGEIMMWLGASSSI